jgi:hypothetical protein
VDVKPSAALYAPLVKMALYAVVTAVSFPLVQGAPLVGVQTKPVAVPFDAPKPEMVFMAPTLPVTAEVPVFETVPPRNPKELAVARLSELPKAGTTAATAITNQVNLCRIFPPVALRASVAQNCKNSQEDRRQIGA